MTFSLVVYSNLGSLSLHSIFLFQGKSVKMEIVLISLMIEIEVQRGYVQMGVPNRFVLLRLRLLEIGTQLGLGSSVHNMVIS